MTREAIEEELTQLVDDLAEYAIDTFRPGRAVLGVSVPGGNKVKHLLDDEVNAALDEIKQDMETQIDLVLSYAEAYADGDGSVDQYLDRFYASNPVMKRVDNQSDRSALADDLGQHFERLGKDIAPVLEAETDEYEEALRQALTKEEAKELVDDHLDQIDYFFEYRDAIRFTETIGTGLFSKEIEYTDEALRVLRGAKEQARTHAYEQIEAAYQD